MRITIDTHSSIMDLLQGSEIKAMLSETNIYYQNDDITDIVPSPFTDEEIEANIIKLQSDFDNLEYSRLREIEYAKLNQDEMRFDDLENGTDLWREAIRAIKLAIPKP